MTATYLELHPNNGMLRFTKWSINFNKFKKLQLYIEYVLLSQLGYYSEYCDDHIAITDLRYQILHHLVFALSQEIPST